MLAENPLQLAMSDGHLDTAVAHLKTLHHHAYLQYVLAVGHYLVEHFFAGDFEATHDQDRTKQHSFNELVTRRRAELHELDLSVATMRRYMAATEVWRALPETTRTRLGMDQLQRLAAVSDDGERKRLAHDAATMQWTRDQVAIAVKEFKTSQRHGNKKPGPKGKPLVLKAATALHGAARKLVKLHGAATQLDDPHRAALLAELDAVRLILQTIRP